MSEPWGRGIKFGNRMFIKRSPLKVKKFSEKSQRKQLEKKLDDVARKLCHLRGRCEVCLRTKPDVILNWAHIYGRRSRSVRWDMDNCLLLCSYHHDSWQPEKPLEFAEFVRRKLGDTKYQMLILRANSSAKWSIGELEIMLTDLKFKLAQEVAKK